MCTSLERAGSCMGGNPGRHETTERSTAGHCASTPLLHLVAHIVWQMLAKFQAARNPEELQEISKQVFKDLLTNAKHFSNRHANMMEALWDRYATLGACCFNTAFLIICLQWMGTFNWRNSSQCSSMRCSTTQTKLTRMLLLLLMPSSSRWRFVKCSE